MTPIDWGVNYRALHDLFEMSQSREHVCHYEIGVQMLEIYNEQLRDLLATDSSHKKYPSCRPSHGVCKHHPETVATFVCNHLLSC